MDLKEQLETQRKEAVTALQILLGYADELAAGGLDRNRGMLEGLKRFSRCMASYLCVEGHDQGCDERIMEKYIQPYEKMLAGDKNALDGVPHQNITSENMDTFWSAISRYRQEMLADYDPVYDVDLEFCDSIVKIMGKQVGDPETQANEMYEKQDTSGMHAM